MIIIMVIGLMFSIYPLKSFFIQKILHILAWEKIEIYDLKKEVVLTERLTAKSGVMTFFEPCVSFSIIYKGHTIHEKLVFHHNVSTVTQQQREKFLQKIRFIRLYINPINPKQYYIIKPETHIQFLLIGILLFIFAFGLKIINA